MMRSSYLLFWTSVVVFCLFSSASAQTTEFTYQGSLKDGATAATGNYDFEFALFDSLSAGTQIGSTLTRNTVAVAGGTFAVKLDFGSQFPGANRFLEIRVRPSGGGGYTTLSPRQPVNSAPYSVQSLNADQLGGVAANQYVTTTGGGTNFIQNTTVQQPSSNFDISGDGTAGGTLSGNIVNATAQYNIGGNRILSNAGNFNLFVGVGAGTANTFGQNNSFFGLGAGTANTVGHQNSFFGVGAGTASTFGQSSSFFGKSAGYSNTSGSENSFFGTNTGFSNTTGFRNTLIGYSAEVGAYNLNNATAIGANALVSTNNSLVLGNAVNVGIGTSSPQYKLHVVGENLRLEGNSGSVFPRFSLNFTGGGADQKKWQNYATSNRLAFTALNDAESAETFWMYVDRGAGTSISRVAFPNGFVQIDNLGAAGATSLCLNALNQISTCSSSLRYKTNISRFGFGLNLVKQLQPITFDWKQGGMHDLGLGAEDVAAIEPLLVTYNKDGQVEGVKYDRIGVVLVNAIKEQQAQIEAQQNEIEQLKRRVSEVDALKKLVCSLKIKAEVCK